MGLRRKMKRQLPLARKFPPMLSPTLTPRRFPVLLKRNGLVMVSALKINTNVATAHLITFASITLVFIGGYVLFTYGPDRTLEDWAQREAYLTLRHREAAGLPLIDMNYVDVSSLS